MSTRSITVKLGGLPADHRMDKRDKELRRLLLKTEDLEDWERFNYFHLTRDPDFNDAYNGTPF